MTDALRGGARRGVEADRRPAERAGLHPRRDRGDQPRRAHAAEGRPQPRPAFAARASQQHRAVAACRLRSRRGAADRRRPDRPRRRRSDADRRASRRRLRARVERARLDPRREARGGDRAFEGRAAAARRLPGGAAHCRWTSPTIGADFYAFSAHKLYGPTGIGCLWGRAELLAAMPPWQGGGAMIEKVTFEETTFLDPPSAVRSGNAAHRRRGRAARGGRLGREAVARRDPRPRMRAGRRDAARRCRSIPGVTLYGPEDSAGIVSFNVDGVHRARHRHHIGRCGRRGPRRPPLRAAADATGSASRRPRGRASRRTATARTSRRWCAGSSR